jgi:ankyrin repeat protein
VDWLISRLARDVGHAELDLNKPAGATTAHEEDTPLLMAVENGNLGAVEVLIRRGANVRQLTRQCKVTLVHLTAY